jgi:hypothetical protein
MRFAAIMGLDKNGLQCGLVYFNPARVDWIGTTPEGRVIVHSGGGMSTVEGKAEDVAEFIADAATDVFMLPLKEGRDVTFGEALGKGHGDRAADLRGASMADVALNHERAAAQLQAPKPTAFVATDAEGKEIRENQRIFVASLKASEAAMPFDHDWARMVGRWVVVEAVAQDSGLVKVRDGRLFWAWFKPSDLRLSGPESRPDRGHAERSKDEILKDD